MVHARGRIVANGAFRVDGEKVLFKQPQPEPRTSLVARCRADRELLPLRAPATCSHRRERPFTRHVPITRLVGEPALPASVVRAGVVALGHARAMHEMGSVRDDAFR